MRLRCFPCLVALAFAGTSLVSGRAQAFSSSVLTDQAPAPEPSPGPTPVAPSSESVEVPSPALRGGGQATSSDDRDAVNRPFHSLAFAVKVGINGIGFDFATPINHFLHLRAGAQFFDDTVNINTDGILANGDITLQNVHASADIFPFRRSSFHISPGVTLHNDNHIAGPISIPGGQSFSLGDIDYTSDPTNPIQGFSRLRFGSSVAPSITVGFGNMLPRSGSHFSVPVEIGFQYTSAPTLDLVLEGNACSASGCGPINSADGPDNLQSEIQIIESDISPLRFFPIASIGLSYKFGR